MSAYVKFSMADPERAGVSYGKKLRSIMGITENGNSWCSHSKAGDQALGIFDRK
jgi:hypothetical protein